MTLLETFSSLFWNSQHKGYVRPNMCLQIFNSCHTQVTLSPRPFNIALGKSSKAQISFTQIFRFQEQLNCSILIFCEQISLPKSGWSTSVMNKRLQGKPQTSEVDITQQRKGIKVLLKCSNQISDCCKNHSH